MHIVFLGNCQVGALSAILQRFVAPYIDITTDFVDAYHNVDAQSYQRLKRADVVVAQASEGTPKISVIDVATGVRVHLVPVVSGAFLYPYHGVLHPAKPVEAAGTTPFQPEFSDRYLAKLYMAHVEPVDALRRYRAHDVAAQAAVGRLYEIMIEGQRKLDAITGYACADLIERHLSEEQLFQSAFHFSGRIAAHLAASLCNRLGFDAKYGQRIRDHLRDAPFVRLFVPVHPSIARFFGMRWVTEETRYPYRFEGSFTFDEYVIRFMSVRWSEAMQAGVLAASQGDPGAKALLEKGLREAPRSAEGPHALSRILESEGDMEGAIAMQRRAAAVALDADMPLRLADLLLRAGDPRGAEKALRRAIDLDPVNHAAWSSLSRALAESGDAEAARTAARQASIYAVDGKRAKCRVAAAQSRASDICAEAASPLRAVSPGGLILDTVAHIQNQGDTLSDLDGVAGTPGSGLAVEGFMILENPAITGCGLTCQPVFADMSVRVAVEAGEFCGTRGENRPLHGFRLCVDAEVVSPVEVICEAWFVGGEYLGPVPAGTLCKADSRAPLEALRIVLTGGALMEEGVRDT